jgi:hypothetical protein
MDTPKADCSERLLHAGGGCYRHGQSLTALAEDRTLELVATIVSLWGRKRPLRED